MHAKVFYKEPLAELFCGFTTFQSSIFPAGNDFTAITNRMLTFSNGSKRPQTVLISTASDDVVEDTETFTVSLMTNETTVTVVPTSAAVIVNIKDNSSK